MQEQACTSDSPGVMSLVKQILGTDSVEEFTKPGYDAIRDAVICGNSLPEGVEREYYAKQENFNKIMKDEANRILDVMEMVVSAVWKGRHVRGVCEEERAETVVDANDTLLDRANSAMDVAEGIRKEEEATEVHGEVSGSWNKPRLGGGGRSVWGRPDLPRPPEAPATPSLTTAKLNIRPQLNFKTKVDNSHNPWVPGIKEKPNSLKPLAILVECTDDGEECYSHPYEYELDRWHPAEERLRKVKVVGAKPLAETPLVYVETEAQLSDMLAELKEHKEMAVDLEHHSYRSFLGFTCLMQISTRDKDYIIDTLSLRSELHVLNEVFTKPDVLKVVHGAENDVEWLQRDLSLYLVNLFDSHQAAKLLDLPRLSLAHLLARYCHVDADKHFQLFDWRTRPLPEDAINYAREDTHYLLTIYAIMNNELIERANGATNLLESVYHRSTQICKKRYMKPILDEDSHMLLYRKGKRMFDNRQLYALKELYRWRDRVAREIDESIGYVLPTHMMMQIAENLPREMQGILACCNPIPPVLRQGLREVHYILLEAREQPLVKTIQESRSAAVDRRTRASVVDKWAGMEPLRDDLPTLLDGGLEAPPPLPDIRPSLPIALDEEDAQLENSKKIMQRLLDIENRKYRNPYQRYKQVLPYVNKVEKEQREKEEKEYEEAKRREKQREAEKSEEVLKQGVIKLKMERPPSGPATPLSQQASGSGSRSQVTPKREASEAVFPTGSKKRKSKGDTTPRAGLKAEEEAGEDVRVGVINVQINTSEDRQPGRSFAGYDYKNADYDRFHSGRGRFMKFNESPGYRGKRKQQFVGKNMSFKNKRGR